MTKRRIRENLGAQHRFHVERVTIETWANIKTILIFLLNTAHFVIENQRVFDKPEQSSKSAKVVQIISKYMDISSLIAPLLRFFSRKQVQFECSRVIAPVFDSFEKILHKRYPTFVGDMSGSSSSDSSTRISSSGSNSTKVVLSKSSIFFCSS